MNLESKNVIFLYLKLVKDFKCIQKYNFKKTENSG